MTFFKNKLAVTIVVLSVGFLVLIGVSIKREKVSVVESGVGSTLNSVQGLAYKSANKIKDSFSIIFNFSKVKKENEELKAKNDELEKQLVENGFEKSEYDQLKEMFNFKNQRSEYNYEACNIIGKSGGNFLDGFIIDKGNKDNIKKGMVVATGTGLVGQVTSTASNWAIVQSISNENIAVSGMIEGAGDKGIIVGYKDYNNNLLARIYDLPQNSTVKKGDVILTSGDGNLYPKGIRVGQVIDVEDDKVNMSKSAIIEPYVNFNKLEEVLIIIPKDIRDIKY